MNKKNIIIISPTTECVCLAAHCYSRWDEMLLGGRKYIAEVLQTLAKGAVIKEALLFIPYVHDVAKTRKALKALAAKGSRITWLAHPGENPQKTCESIERVTCLQYENIEQAYEYLAPNKSPGFAPNNPGLRAYSRYKNSLSFMKLMDPGPLAEAAEVLSAMKKPFSLAELPKSEQALVERFRDADFPYLEGRTKTVLDLKARVRQVAPTELSTLVIGETGTGKEAVAFYLHEFSERREKPFVPINCAGLDETFLRSELFGHEQGSFTGAVRKHKGLVEQADGGTLFLDELVDMPIPVQADLLRFLQTKRYRPLGAEKEKQADIRLIAGAQPAIRKKMKDGEFREDLYFRIAHVTLETPALRDVPEDIIRIIRHIIYSSVSSDYDDTLLEKIAYFEQGRDILTSHTWPGNVRELAGHVSRHISLGDDVLEEIAQAAPVCTGSSDEAISFGPVRGPNSVLPLEEVAGRYARHVFENKGNMTQKKLAERLGVVVNTLKKYLGKC